ncbi:hypothetical protein C1H46_028663 [Malus baccata]|uniref:Uncharacterized protein n=1 Tax=Malus baccata TaxID=106549 RepID=A0A540LGZ9_MALBA|nr:hypothetical protein C1H46_028663 [Malus baccata]
MKGERKRKATQFYKFAFGFFNRFCEETNSVISDVIGVSFPIKDGIPSLVPTDGKTLEVDDTVKPEDSAESSDKHEAD